MGVLELSKSNNLRNKGSKKKIRIVALVIAIIAILALTVALLLNLTVLGEGARMTQYLEDKYNQKFSVEDVKTQSGGIATAYTFKATAHPTSDPSLAFTISRVDGDKEYHDTFLTSLWSRQASDELMSILQNDTNGIADYHAVVSLIGTLSDRVDSKTPSFQEMKASAPDAISYTLVAHGSAKASANEPSEAELKRAMALVTLIKSQHIEKSALSYAYNSADFNKTHPLSGERLYEYRISVDNDNLQNITSADQLTTYFKKIN